MRHWISGEGICWQREGSVLCLEVEAFLPGGNVLGWRGQGRARAGELPFNWGIQKGML